MKKMVDFENLLIDICSLKDKKFFRFKQKYSRKDIFNLIINRPIYLIDISQVEKNVYENGKENII